MLSFYEFHNSECILEIQFFKKKKSIKQEVNIKCHDLSLIQIYNLN